MIRAAEPADIPRIVTQCRRHHAEQQAIGNPNFDWLFDPVVVSMTIKGAVESAGWLCLVGGNNLLLAHVCNDPLGAPRFAFERVIRGDLNCLVPAFEKWGRAMGCLRSVLSTTHRHAAFARLYRRHGYALAETVYTKAL
jgi:hypothetical protein